MVRESVRDLDVGVLFMLSVSGSRGPNKILEVDLFIVVFL